MSKTKIVLFRIKFIDLYKVPLEGLYHIVTINGRTACSGESIEGGHTVWISKPAGTRFNVSIKDPRNGSMIDILKDLIVPLNRTTFEAHAPFAKHKFKLKMFEGPTGNYLRKTHEVKTKETLSSIAKIYGLQWQQIAQLNSLKEPYKIRPKDVLKLPPTKARQQGTEKSNPHNDTKSSPQGDDLQLRTEYEVQRGETLSEISQRSGISVAELKRINGITDPKTLQSGQTIKLRNSDSARSPAAQPRAKPVPPSSFPNNEEKGLLDRAQDAVKEMAENLREGIEDFNDAVSGPKEGESADSPRPFENQADSANSNKTTPTQPSTPIDTQTSDDRGPTGTPKVDVTANKPPIIFPLLVKPLNDPQGSLKNYDWTKMLEQKGASQAVFGRGRSSGRKHAGRDLYSNIHPINQAKPGDKVISIAPGRILRIVPFYLETYQVSIKHTTTDNRTFIVRYGELDPASITHLKEGHPINQEDRIGNTGVLTRKNGKAASIVDKNNVSMLHFEYFTGKNESLDTADNLTQKGKNKYSRRSDMADPLEILLEGYRASILKQPKKVPLTKRIDISKLYLSAQGENFIKSYESIKYSNRKTKSLYYNDDSNYCTVGWGHLVNGKRSCASQGIVAEKDSITVEEAERLFQTDKKTKGENLVKRAIKVPLHQYEFDALVSLAFNVGSLEEIAPKLCQKINNSQYSSGSVEMLDITKSNGKELRGLVIRRKKEHEMFNKNTYDLHR